MPTAEHTRYIQRRLDAARRKYEKAIEKFIRESVFKHEETYYGYKSYKDSLEVTTLFRVHGDPQKYRFGYEINLRYGNPLPKVGEIRQFMFESFKDYKNGLKPVPAPTP